MFLGNDQADFDPPVPIMDTDRMVRTFVTADLDGDGDLDAAVVLDRDASAPQRIVRLLNDGAGRFTADTIIDGANAYQFLQVADVTGDGAPDIVLNRTNGSTFEVVYLAAQGAGYAPPNGLHRQQLRRKVPRH